jgi:uncharacterized membrane protein
MAAEFGSGDSAVKFMVSAGLVFEIVAAACSSPQTAEINADKRAATLMKWVKIGLGIAAVFVAITVIWLDADHWPSLLGGALAGAIMGALYVYANRCGLASGAPGTED